MMRLAEVEWLIPRVVAVTVVGIVVIYLAGDDSTGVEALASVSIIILTGALVWSTLRYTRSTQELLGFQKRIDIRLGLGWNPWKLRVGNLSPTTVWLKTIKLELVEGGKCQASHEDELESLLKGETLEPFDYTVALARNYGKPYPMEFEVWVTLTYESFEGEGSVRRGARHLAYPKGVGRVVHLD